MLLLPLEMPGPFLCCSRLSQLTGQEKVGPPFAAGKPHSFSGLETEFRQRHFPAGLDVFGREYGAGPHRRSDERPATATSAQPHPETTGKSADGSARSTGLAGAFAEPVSFPLTWHSPFLHPALEARPESETPDRGSSTSLVSHCSWGQRQRGFRGSSLRKS